MVVTDGKNGQFNLEEFTNKSLKYYEKLKADLEVKFSGKYAALDFQDEKYWLGDTPAEALTRAKKDSPNKLFFVVQVGSPAAFSIQSINSRNLFCNPTRDLNWAHR